jgi:hypothetical protein
MKRIALALLALFTLTIAAQTIDAASAAPRQHCYGSKGNRVCK